MFEVVFLERMEIEHLLRFLDEATGKEGQHQSQLHRLRSRRIIRSRVRYWLNDIVDEMRKKSPASVQKWVDSIQMPNSAGPTSADPNAALPIGALRMQDEPDGTVSAAEQLVDVTGVNDVNECETKEGVEQNEQISHLETHGEVQEWSHNVERHREDHHVEHEDEQEEDGIRASGSEELVLMDGPQKDHEANATVAVASTDSSTPKVAKLDDAAPKPVADSSAGLSLRNFLSKKSILGKFSRSGSNLDHSPTASAENAPSVGSSSSMETDEATGRRGVVQDGVGTPTIPSPSPFVVGKSKINEFYDKLGMNKAKYSLIKAKKLDIRNMLGGVTLGGSREPKATDAQSNTPHEEDTVQDYSTAKVDEETVGVTLVDSFEKVDDRSSSSPQHPEPLEVSVIDVDPSDAYEFSFDESFPKSDEFIPGMISEEDEEKENILDTTAASITSGHGHGYGYDAYLNPPKPKTHRIGIGRIGRSSSENPRATARRYNLMEIGRSFSEMNDDDDSFAISEGNNSCPNPSSLNTSSSINEHGSAGNLTRSVPVSPIPRTSSKLSIHQEHHLGQHSTPGGPLLQQHSMVDQSSHSRRRSTMLVKDSSLQSDSSRCSSVESLLNARKPDPEKILLNLGFGPAPHSTDVLAKIPKRFLKPSQVRGVDTEAFLRQQQLSMHIHENSVLGYRGLVGNPHIPPSMIVAKIMERFQENDSKTRLTASGLPGLVQSDSRNSSGPPSPVPMTRHASLATTDGRLKF
ncbi:AGAP005635-PA-like protein [Anopheles sinensis]|uniref:AGAP005635-PA-like protein n=1 Tax=Anopheles sinensis TaxID=74873 RepID=A0A084W9Y8_ANOSI|nr:AGAP005635-PA-like protein [Anopheles sinensis]